MKNVALYVEETTGDPYLDLAAAVVRCAIKDYKRMKKKRRYTESGLDAERFILSRQFDIYVLGTIDGRELLNKIDEEVSHEKRKKEGWH